MGMARSEEYQKERGTKSRCWLQLIFRSCDQWYIVATQEDYSKDGIYKVPRFLAWETECIIVSVIKRGDTGEEKGQDFEKYLFERKIAMSNN